MKTDHVPKKLPMRGNRKVSKTIRLAQQMNRPEYFQHTYINSLVKNNKENNNVQEESLNDSPLVEHTKEEIRKEVSKGKRRKAIAGEGLLD
jgi:hypothetical protein